MRKTLSCVLQNHFNYENNYLYPDAAPSATAVNAQTIVKGDMNGDDEITIADVTSTVDVVLGKSPKQTISLGGNPYQVDNTLVVGTLYAPGGTLFTLSDDGTTDYPGAATYKFRPNLGMLTFYDTSAKAIRVLGVVEAEKDHLLLLDYATGDCMYYYRDMSGSDGVYDYVDLGLPSGTLWATCNIGATSPEDYGDYFAWGETAGYNDGKTKFNWSTHKWCEGSSSTMTKYCTDSSYGYNGFTDNKTELDLEDDAAYVNWGPAWRMPSIEQFAELINSDYTTTEWTTQNGVYGRKITSKVAGYEGNFIFLPAAGDRDNSSLGEAGSDGNYWSRTLGGSYPNNARGLYFHSGFIRTYDGSRYYGRSMRPVRLSE